MSVKEPKMVLSMKCPMSRRDPVYRAQHTAHGGRVVLHALRLSHPGYRTLIFPGENSTKEQLRKDVSRRRPKEATFDPRDF